MKKFDDVKGIVDEGLEMITVDSKAHKEALDRSTKFLTIVATLSDYRRQLEEKKSKVVSLREAFYTTAVNNSSAKNVTEKKFEAAMDKNYTAQREEVEKLEAKISWVKTHMDIFNNAHITYRQLYNEE